jgi:Tfp pilus assembly PilM family ATPase/Tfp pilus assembly protein PilN
MYTALIISSYNLKILSIKGRRIKTWASAELAGGLVRDGLILQPQAVGEAINSLFKSTGVTKENVIFSVSGMSFTYRFIKLPPMKSSLVEEAILRAAKKEISLPLDELYITWQAIPGKGEEQEYFVIGVPRNFVDAAVQTLKTAGIEPYLMGLRPLAVARTAYRGEAIVVNMEPDCADIVIVNKGIPVVIHTINPRSEEASLEDNIRYLAGELSKTLAFYRSNNQDIQLHPSTPLLLTGEFAAQTIAGGLLQAEVEYPVESLKPPIEYPHNLPIDIYASSIGLAFKKTPPKYVTREEGTHFFDININLLAGKYRKPKAKPVPVRNWLTAVIILALIGFLYPLYQARSQTVTDNNILETDLNSADRELNLATLVNEETGKTEAEISSILAIYNTLKTAGESIYDTRGIYSAGLQRMTGVMPPKTAFTSLEIRKDGITIAGETDSISTVVQYATDLEAQGVFRQVRITNIDELPVTLPAIEGDTGAPSSVIVITFEISCIY